MSFLALALRPASNYVSKNASTYSCCAWLSVVSWRWLAARLARRGHDRARREKAARKLHERNAELVPQAALQAAIILRAAEDLADQIAECRRVAQHLHHSSGDRSTQKVAAKYPSRDLGGEFQIGGKSRPQPLGIGLRLAFHQRLRKQIAGTQRVIKALASERVHARRGVAHHRPVFSGDAAAAYRLRFRRRQNVAIKSRALHGNLFFLDELVEVAAELLRRILAHLCADADRKMIGARKRP